MIYILKIQRYGCLTVLQNFCKTLVTISLSYLSHKYFHWILGHIYSCSHWRRRHKYRYFDRCLYRSHWYLKVWYSKFRYFIEVVIIILKSVYSCSHSKRVAVKWFSIFIIILQCLTKFFNLQLQWFHSYF